MTEEEVDEYINQVAFSGATEFLEKYKDKTNEEQIIGHFGLGFYSAFMVADSVSIIVSTNTSSSLKSSLSIVSYSCSAFALERLCFLKV